MFALPLFPLCEKCQRLKFRFTEVILKKLFLSFLEVHNFDSYEHVLIDKLFMPSVA